MHLKRWIGTGIVLLLLLGIALLGFGFLLPYYWAEAEMSNGHLDLTAQYDGTWEVRWGFADGANIYRVELYQGEPEESNLVYRDFAYDNTVDLPQIPADQSFTIRVYAGAEFKTLFGESVRYVQTPLEAQVRFEAPVLDSFEVSVNGDDKTATVSVKKSEDVDWICLIAYTKQDIITNETVSGTSTVLTFGENGKYPMPKEGESCNVWAIAYRDEPDAFISGPPTSDFSITAEALQMRKLNPVLTETSKNTIDLAWSETRGDHYEVQQLINGGWETIKQVAQGDPRHFFAWVSPGETRTYRVVAVDEQGQYPVISENLEFTGKALAKNATIWPTRNLAALSHPHSGEILDYAIEGHAYWVLEEVDGAFAVRIGDQICYIDSNYCLINLPEYIGGLCNYSITNATSSIYAVHDFPIPNVTGVVTAGYENVQQTDGTTLVPLLYPTAKKLVRAAQAAMDQGYRLKIYDSFRPYVATREVYDLTAAVLGQPLPDETYLGVPKSSLDLPEPQEGHEELTLGWLMTGRYYDLRSFLARDGSSHNLGIAMDLTMEDLKTGVEIPMQSKIHDLSHYSVLSENNEAADLLSSFMQKAGFGTLVSEWWHFQDNASKEGLGLNPVVNGLDAACWVKDDNGWRYRSPKGAFYAGKTVDISGTSYTFNNDGYVVE